MLHLTIQTHEPVPIAELIPSCRQPAITTGVARASAVLPIASLFLDVARVDPKGMLFLAKVLTTTAQCLNLVNAL